MLGSLLCADDKQGGIRDGHSLVGEQAGKQTVLTQWAGAGREASAQEQLPPSTGDTAG